MTPTASRRPTLFPLLALLVALALGASAAIATFDGSTKPVAQAAAAFSTPTADHALAIDPDLQGEISISDEDLGVWNEMVESSEGRARVVADLQDSFAGVAEFGMDESSAAAEVAEPGEAQLVLAYGATSTHFWITASYADMARGAIWTAVRACATKLPSWLCTTVGSVLTKWSYGWGSGSNHGVWAAIYWSPLRYTGGRW